ncbi:hypothetical protein EIKCOROL_00502 [Eikenella corrodens ATCC 23834]|uniref:Uncharacterized protein n=1 Tax=Eikenella corrodens ATCC 23834 TaxID=546274 RepID=C0DT28_EIKCO|nr:hypothetical protein EIKCOROL_00502 [Eikenella corrodens ATCC 23834]
MLLRKVFLFFINRLIHDLIFTRGSHPARPFYFPTQPDRKGTAYDSPDSRW